MSPNPSRRNIETSAALHPLVYGALAVCTLWVVAATWAFFARDIYTAVQLAVVTVFAAMFLATPLVLSHLAGRRSAPAPKFREWAEGEFETIDGTIDAKHAVVMVLCSAVACAAGITAIGLVARLVSIGAV